MAPDYTQTVRERYAATLVVPLAIAALSVGIVAATPMDPGLRTIVLGVLALFYAGLIAVTRRFGCLSIRVDAERLHVGFGAKLAVIVPIAEIAICTPHRYRAIAEWGGWGYRLGGNGVMLNVFGDGGRAVKVVRHDGRELYFSARDPEGVCRAIAAQRVADGA